jgi:hypothetical protein
MTLVALTQIGKVLRVLSKLTALVCVKASLTNKAVITLVPYPLVLPNSLKLFVDIGASRIVCTLVKDVVFQEDAIPLRHHNAASNWSLIRNIVINIARHNGYNFLTKAERFLAHDIDRLFSLLE